MAQRKGMFAAFADEDEEVVQPAKPVKKTTAAPAKVEDKKVERPQTAKPFKPAAINGAGFDGVTGADEGRPQRGGRGGDRGGRGGDRGGDRGGRGGRGGERRGPRPEGEPRPEGGAGRGERRPRQEGDRPRYEGDRPIQEGDRPRYEGDRPRQEGDRPRYEGYRPRQEGDRPRTEGGAGRGERRPRPPRVEGGEGAPTEGGDEGVVYRPRKERVEGGEHRFEGKKREQFHPFDRKDGTGRGRGFSKGGHGKGNWGTAEDETKVATEEGAKDATTEQPVAEESKTEEVVEKREEAPVEVREPTEDDLNAKKLTLAEYLAQKKKSTLKKEGRAHEDNTAKKTGLEAVKATRDRVETIVNTIKDQEVYNVAVGKSELSNLLSFQA